MEVVNDHLFITSRINVDDGSLPEVPIGVGYAFVQFYKFKNINSAAPKPISTDIPFLDETLELLDQFEKHSLRFSEVGFKEYILIGHYITTDNKRYKLYYTTEIPHCFKKKSNLRYTKINVVDFQNKLNIIQPGVQGNVIIQALHQQQPLVQRVRKSKPVALPAILPSYVSDLLISDAVTKAETCPISYEPLTKENCVATSCFHLFDRETLNTWRRKSNECPKCRTVCSITL